MYNKNVKKKLGENIRKTRKKNKLLIKELCTYADVSKNTIINIERGQANCNLDTIIKISNALEISISTLFEN